METAKGGAKEADDYVRENFKRTFKGVGNEVSQANSNGIASTAMLPFTAKADGDVYSTFIDCYNGVLKDGTSKKAAENKQLDALKEFFAKNGVAGLQKMEESLECGGACSAPLFYVTRSFNQQPVDTCFNQVVAKIGSGARTVGIVAIITALISFCAFCGSFPLCTKFNDQEGEDK